jgi:hypothetical protein
MLVSDYGSNNLPVMGNAFTPDLFVPDNSEYLYPSGSSV